ncbi:ribosomal RNA processing protein 1 homolog B-like [Hypomesus transpacificus]|uniref:ribosomal RNA processing protein 1 homolog B-like n=1 Tax=Hypomesus transpacificus TaxID=137520 RepID=UPI001F07E766|nr:ribosomal RNA processing protein 1 homolog B-like [Hypomesus transpacificus]
MAPIQQGPEIQFAQRLASNEKHIRKKAIKKLRKYISVRSQRIKGGFTGDELLKLWKGLFYCLWMQDKPLLQEELSNQIAGFLHNFQSVDSQFQYLETFLQTIKREWTGIDRLRMDKFYQLVRLVFRQTFEMLKKKGWETSILARFLELLTAQVLQSTSGAPCGLLFHIMDLYMTELAGVGSAELTAEQNLTFIKPFCKSAAKTKDRILLRAICNSIFSVIVDQAPFAIEDLMKEMKNAQTEDSDSGQASEEEDENVKTKRTVKYSKKSSGKSTNDDEEEDKLFNLENGLDIELPDDEGIGPVLQFDYGALADELFQLASRNNTPSFNRQKLYKVIKMLRDLSEGAFPQDEYPEEVSTDEDDEEMFGSRKRMKREKGLGEKEEENAVKKLKGKTKNKSEHSDKGKPIDAKSDATRMKKKKKEKEKGQHAKQHTEEVEESEVKASEDSVLPASSGSQRTSDKDVKKVVPLLSSTEEKTETTALSEARETDTTLDNQSETPLATTIVVGSRFCVTFTEVAEGNQNDHSEIKAIIEEPLNKFETEEAVATNTKSRRKKASDPKVEEPNVEVAKAAEGQSGTQEESITCAAEPQTVTLTPIANIPGGKKCRRKSNKQQESEETTAGREESLKPELQSTPTNTEEPQTEAAPLKTRKRARKQNVVTQEESSETNITPAETSGDLDRTHTETTVNAVHLKKRKRLSKANYQADQDGETPPESETTCPRGWVTATTTVKNTQKHQSIIQERETKDQDQPDVDKGCVGDGEVPAENETLKKVKKRKTSVMMVAKELEAVGEEAAHLSTEVEPGDKKPKLNNDGQEPTTTINTKKLQKTLKDKADFIIFQNNATIPTPLFYKTASGGSSTDSASKKKCQMPKSESKKVTFGLKNNKTAEFRKNDRSLLLSPEGPSRVPFDPQQKPLFGVLKSPALSFTGSTKNTSNGRPTAADFF